MEKFIVLFISLVGMILGGGVFFVNRRQGANQWFAIMSILIVLWINFAYLGSIVKDVLKATFWFRLNLGVVSLTMLSAYYFYIIHFLKQKGKNVFLERFITLISFLLFLITIFTDLVVKTSRITQTGVDLIYGDLGTIYNLFALFIGFILIGYFIKNYAFLSDKEKIRVQYFLLGTIITIFLSLIFNVIYPLLFEPKIQYQLFGDYSLIFLLIFTAYAIIKRELFGIRIILTEALVVIIAILLLVQALNTDNLGDFTWKFILFLTFLYFGYLLIRSVTKEIKQRKEIEEMAMKIQAAYELEKRAKEELTRLDEAKNQFIMASQHHLRTPLTSMRGYVELLLDGTYGKISPKVREILTKFQVSIKRLIKIVNEFLDITQFQLGKEVVTLMPDVDALPILKEIVEELQLETKARGLWLKLEKAKDIPKIKADPEKLKIALFNIVDNAIKYTIEGGVTIKVAKSDSKIQIAVKDTGVGISKEEQKELFNRLFERGKEAGKFHTTGRGIGLYITFHIIQAHHGKIWVESEGQGKGGSTFFIELPLN